MGQQFVPSFCDDRQQEERTQHLERANNTLIGMESWEKPQITKEWVESLVFLVTLHQSRLVHFHYLMSLILTQVNKTKVTFIVVGGASPLDPRPPLFNSTFMCVCAAGQVSSLNVLSRLRSVCSSWNLPLRLHPPELPPSGPNFVKVEKLLIPVKHVNFHQN